MIEKRLFELTQRERARFKVARWRERSPEYQRGENAEATDHAQGDAPRSKVGEQAGHEASSHAAEARAADVESHREADGAILHLFAQVGHGDGRESAECDAFDRADQQQRMPAGHERANDRQYCGSEE